MPMKLLSVIMVGLGLLFDGAKAPVSAQAVPAEA